MAFLMVFNDGNRSGCGIGNASKGHVRTEVGNEKIEGIPRD